ncbi:MAG: hypothetical protein II992_12230 [Lachnospiraceae bacterium]|nr:hypothetical protein [Lachnospiraceae bacterium]MBQ3601949.1 hypothetical protein [Lachnospiraceae bacterium]
MIGYKGGTNIKKIYSVDDIRDEKGFTEVIVEIDTEKLEPTGIYQCINDAYQLGDIEKSSVKVFFDRTIKKYGQYYIASLESGEKIPVFIDDSLINMRKKGIIQLPIGVANISKVDFSQYNVQSGYEDLYLDCASGFATGPEMQDFRFMEKMAVLVIIVVMVVFLGIVLGINIGNSRK